MILFFSSRFFAMERRSEKVAEEESRKESSSNLLAMAKKRLEENKIIDATPKYEYALEIGGGEDLEEYGEAQMRELERRLIECVSRATGVPKSQVEYRSFVPPATIKIGVRFGEMKRVKLANEMIKQNV